MLPSDGVPALVASIREHKKFKQLANYSIECLCKVRAWGLPLGPRFRSWSRVALLVINVSPPGYHSLSRASLG